MAIVMPFVPRQAAHAAEPHQFYEMRILDDRQSREAAFAIRRAAYEAAGYALAGLQVDGADRFDDMNTTLVFGAYDGDRLVGTLRTSFSLPSGGRDTLPCEAYYPALADVAAEANGPLAEMSRLAIDPAIANTSYRTTLYASLVRAGYTAAVAANVAMILVATKPEWVRFYRYMLGFEPVGEPQFYPPGDFKITLLAGSLAEAQRRQHLQNRFFKVSTRELDAMRTALQRVLDIPVETASNVTPIRRRG